jgi:outer membrane protein assembly factor BamA
MAQQLPVGAEGRRVLSINLKVRADDKIIDRAPASARRHEIINVLRTREARPFNSDDLARDITYLTTTSHMFRKVEWQVAIDSKLDGVNVTLILTQPLVWRIRVVAPVRGRWSEDGVKDFWRAQPEVDTAEGSEFNIGRLDDDVKRLYDTGGFLDIRTEHKFTERGVDLLFRVIQNEPLAIVQFSGVYGAGFESDLEKVIAGVEPLRSTPFDRDDGELISPRYFPQAAFDGDVVTDANPANILGATRQIEGYYKLAGYAFINVIPRVIALPVKFDRKAVEADYEGISEQSVSVVEGLIGDGYGGRVVLVFEVQEGPLLLIGDMTFSGLKGVDSPGSDALEGSRISGLLGPIESFYYSFLGSRDREQMAALAELMRLKIGSPFVESDALRDGESLQSYLRDRGWLDASVSYAGFKLNDARTRIIPKFHVEAGPVYAFNEIRFEYATRAPRVPKGAEPRDFDAPVAEFTEFLDVWDFDFEALTTEQARTVYGADQVDPFIAPKEGRYFGAFKLAEPIAFDNYELNGEQGKGEGYSGYVRALLADRGYSNSEVQFLRVDTAADELETDWNSPWPVRRVSVIVRIQQGYKSIVGNVNIRGNEATRDDVIRREITLYGGDVYDRNQLRASDVRLRRTQWFEAAAPGQGVTSRSTPRLVVSEGEIIEYTDIDYDVIEGRTNRFNFAAGFNSNTGFTASVDLTLMNFDISSLVSWIWGEPNFSFTGAGQSLSFTAQPPLDRQQIYRISFTEPWLFGYPVQGSASAEYSSINYSDYTRTRLGVDPSIGWRPHPDVLWSFGYSYSVLTLSDVDAGAPDELRDDEGTDVLSTLWSEIRWRTTDNPQFPTTGWVLSYYLGYTGGDLLGGTVDFWRMKASADYYVPVWDIDRTRTLVLAFSLNATWQDVHSNTVEIPFLQRLLLGGNSLGGAGALRGYEFGGVGPSRSGSALGGNFMVQGFAELRFPIFPANLWLVGFIEAGELAPTLNTFDARGITVSGGFGIRLLLPILPIPFALDFGFPIYNQPGNREEVISINLGFGF